jgi:hypothetical protein
MPRTSTSGSDRKHPAGRRQKADPLTKIDAKRGTSIQFTTPAFTDTVHRKGSVADSALTMGLKKLWRAMRSDAHTGRLRGNYTSFK